MTDQFHPAQQKTAMEEDIVKRLRTWNRGGVMTAITPHMMMDDAASEIEALRLIIKENARSASRRSPPQGEREKIIEECAKVPTIPGNRYEP